MIKSALKALARDVLTRVSPGTLVRRHLSGAGDPEIEVALLDILVPQGRQDAVDVGSNWGLYACALAPLCATVHCLEPNPALARILRRTLPKNCEVQQAAASTGFGVATLRVPLDGAREVDGLASLSQDFGASSRAIDVPTIPLDSFSKFPVGFVKIDVEGAEMLVLSGARQLLRERRPVVLIEIEERHRPGAIAEAQAWFAVQGYDGYFVMDGRLNGLETFDIATMQNYDGFDPHASRSTQRYINNFIFAAKGALGPAARLAITHRLVGCDAVI